MKEIWTIIKREYRESVYKKSFIILTLITPILMIALGILPSLFFGFEEEKPVHFNVIDESNVIYNKLTDALNDTLEDGSAKFFIKEVTVSAQLDSVIREQMKTKLMDCYIFPPISWIAIEWSIILKM